MSEKEIADLLENITEAKYIECSESSSYSDKQQFNKIVAALNQTMTLIAENKKLKEANTNLEITNEHLDSRLRHLLKSKNIAAYDEVNPESMDYKRNINEVDSFFKTGNKLLLEYANKNKTTRIGDFVIETDKEKNKIVLYKPELKEIKLELHIIENDTDELCPMCKKEMGQYPAISRKDNKTKICSSCGTIEALEDYIKYSNDKEKDIQR